MKINIRATNIELTSAITLYLEKKLQSLHKILNDEGDREVMMMAIVGKTTKHHKEGEHFMCEVNFSYCGEEYNGKEIDENLYAAIDKVRDELEREITKKREREQNLRVRGGRKLKKKLHAL